LNDSQDILNRDVIDQFVATRGRQTHFLNTLNGKSSFFFVHLKHASKQTIHQPGLDGNQLSIGRAEVLDHGGEMWSGSPVCKTSCEEISKETLKN
jgi:hypothetical protein